MNIFRLARLDSFQYRDFTNGLAGSLRGTQLDPISCTGRTLHKPAVDPAGQEVGTGMAA